MMHKRLTCPRIAALLVVLVVAYCETATPIPAHADFTVSWCQNGNTNPPFINGGTGAEPYANIRYQCESNPPAVEFDTSGFWTGSEEDGRLMAGATARVTVTAPAGLAISRVNTTLMSAHYKSGSGTEVQVGDDGGVVFSHLLSPADTSWIYNINQALPRGDRTITIGDHCTANLNTSCFFSSPYDTLTVALLSLTLHDEEQPSLSLIGGRLLLPGAQASIEDVMFSASAQDSGIAEVDAYLGTTLVGSNAYQSTKCSYTRFDPCPQRISDSLKVDTTKVPDGTYPLIIEASDASGNTVSLASSNPVTVANHVSPAGAPTGTPPSTSSEASSQEPGAPNGHSATTKAQITYVNTHGHITAGHGQTASVSGRLTNQTGAPIPGATVDVLSQTVGSSAAFVVIGHATTDAAGVYTFLVPAGPSRTIRTGYRAFANDNGYDTTADLAEVVTAATSLSVTPARLRGRTFMFRGQVHADSFPPGQQVEIQVLIGRSWSHVTFAPVASDGHFTRHYRLKHHYHRVTFIFRAIPVASPIWPYEPHPSNFARLHLL